MNFTNDTMVWYFLAAVVVGVFIGGKIVLTIMQIMGRSMRPPMPNQPHQYPPAYDPYRPDMYPPSRQGEGCMSFILMGVVGLILVIAILSNTKVKKVFSKEEPVTNSPIESQQNDASAPAGLHSDATPLPIPKAPQQFDPSWYTIQAGVFLEESNAFRKLESLRTMGFEPCYHISVVDGEKRYHVCAGVYSSMENAISEKNSLKHPSAQIYSAGGLEFYK